MDDQTTDAVGGRPVLNLGRIVATPGALESATDTEISAALSRHCRGDWGDLDAFDKLQNDLSLKYGSRILSAYHTPSGTKFWIITEGDRATTTVLLPREY